MSNDNLFIRFIQIAIGRSCSFDEPPSDETWMQIGDTAVKQSLQGFLVDAIDNIPKEQAPSKRIACKCLCLQNNTVARNEKVLGRAEELTSLFDRQGWRTCILKGPGIAACYPNPGSRASGDIDIWVDAPKDEVIRFLDARFQLKAVQFHHCDVKIFDDVETEVHFFPSWSYVPTVHRRYMKWFASQADVQFDNRTRDGFSVPTAGFNLVYLMMHIYRHILIEGVGLRQVMDYYYLLLKSTASERGEAAATIESLSMGRFCAAVMYVLRTVFGLEDEYLVCAPDPQLGKFLYDEIMIGGNFGRFDTRNRASGRESLFARGVRLTRRSLRFLRYFPAEVICAPFFKLWHFSQRKLKGYKIR